MRAWECMNKISRKPAPIVAELASARLHQKQLGRPSWSARWRVRTDRKPIKPPDLTSHLRWPAADCRFREMHHPHRGMRGQPPARLAPSVYFPSWNFAMMMN